MKVLIAIFVTGFSLIASATPTRVFFGNPANGISATVADPIPLATMKQFAAYNGSGPSWHVCFIGSVHNVVNVFNAIIDNDPSATILSYEVTKETSFQGDPLYVKWVTIKFDDRTFIDHSKRILPCNAQLKPGIDPKFFH